MSSLRWHNVVPGRLYKALAWLVTFMAVVVAWVLFRAETFSGAVKILQGMAGMNGFKLPAAIVAIVPGLSGWVEAASSMPLLGQGRIMGIFELGSMFVLMFALIAMPASHEMGPKLRFVAIVASAYFTIQAVVFGRAPSEFLYFQF